MFFSKMMPRETSFFPMFNQHAELVVKAAEALVALVRNYDDVSLRERNHKSVDDMERAADKITHEVNVALHKTFITPIDREQIHGLINSMDDVADLIQDSAQAMVLYDVRKVTPEIVQLADLGHSCCLRMQSAVAMLDKLSEAKTAEAALKACEEIDRLESDADHVLRTALSKLFREEPDVRELIKLKALYELMERVTDICEDVANLIEGIVLENS